MEKAVSEMGSSANKLGIDRRSSTLMDTCLSIYVTLNNLNCTKYVFVVKKKLSFNNIKGLSIRYS